MTPQRRQKNGGCPEWDLCPRQLESGGWRKLRHDLITIATQWIPDTVSLSRSRSYISRTLRHTVVLEVSCILNESTCYDIQLVAGHDPQTVKNVFGETQNVYVNHVFGETHNIAVKHVSEETQGFFCVFFFSETCLGKDTEVSRHLGTGWEKSHFS